MSVRRASWPGSGFNWAKQHDDIPLPVIFELLAGELRVEIVLDDWGPTLPDSSIQGELAARSIIRGLEPDRSVYGQLPEVLCPELSRLQLTWGTEELSRTPR